MMMKPLSERQARRCEEAREPVCVCRCGGRLHGSKRGGANSNTPRSFFETLPEGDPHYVPSAEAVAAEKAAKRQAHAEGMARRYAARARFEAGIFD